MTARPAPEDAEGEMAASAVAYRKEKGTLPIHPSTSTEKKLQTDCEIHSLMRVGGGRRRDGGTGVRLVDKEEDGETEVRR